MSQAPLRVAALGMGWWSDVLADAIKRSKEIEIVACYTRSEDKRRAFAAKYGCRRRGELRGDPEGSLDRGHHQHHAQQRAPGDDAGGGASRQARVPRQADRQHRARGPARSPRCARRPAWCWRSATSAAAKATSAGSRPRSTPGASASWCRPSATSAATGSASSISPPGAITAAGMPGGVMLQIGIHYVDVLEFLMGPVTRVSARLAQLVLPGDNPDVANMILQHENNALSNLTASYASASEFYMMNIYGKEASAYYDLFSGLRHLKRGEKAARAIATEKNDTIREELEEFARCVAQRRQARDGRLLGRAQPRRHQGGREERARGPRGRGGRDHGERRVIEAQTPGTTLPRIDIGGLTLNVEERGQGRLSSSFPGWSACSTPGISRWRSSPSATAASPSTIAAPATATSRRAATPRMLIARDVIAPDGHARHRQGAYRGHLDGRVRAAEPRHRLSRPRALLHLLQHLGEGRRVHHARADDAQAHRAVLRRGGVRQGVLAVHQRRPCSSATISTR